MEPLPGDDSPGRADGDRRPPESAASPAPPSPGAQSALAAKGDAAPTERDRAILEAIAQERGSMEELAARLVAAPTVLGDEEPGQAAMREALEGLGLRPIDVPMDADALRAHPGHSPFSWDVGGKANVVATWEPAPGTDESPGRSLILNGHIDVVSPEPLARWGTPPFEASRDGDWMYGRGAADMKSGLAAIIGAVAGLRRLGGSPRAPVTLESVVEEECTGNGTLQCILAGYTADAAIVAEPFGAGITTSQVGVLWFDVRVAGVPGHAGEERPGSNAIEQSYAVVRALRGLEAELNVAPPPPYDRLAHPISMNVGVIRGGDWPSTAPGECVISYRIALYPGTRIRDLQDRIEAIVAEVAAADPAFVEPPQVLYDGFASHGYSIGDDAPLVVELAGAFGRATGGPPALVPTTGTSDAGMLGLYGETPAVCFGPYAERVHAVDERVYLPSIVQTAQVLGLFIADWCGLDG
jgi:acetylornithine deacetylase